MSKRYMQKGFTLVEVLTVVLVIAVLTAVALPQYRRVVQRAESAEAISMLRSLYDSSERLAAEFGARSYQQLLGQFQSNPDRIDMFHLDIMPSGENDGYDFRCNFESFAMWCPYYDDRTGQTPKWLYWLRTNVSPDPTDGGNLIVALRLEGRYAGTQLIFDRSDQNIYCIPASDDENGRACNAYNVDVRTSAAQFSREDAEDIVASGEMIL